MPLFNMCKSFKGLLDLPWTSKSKISRLIMLNHVIVLFLHSLVVVFLFIMLYPYHFLES